MKWWTYTRLVELMSVMTYAVGREMPKCAVFIDIDTFLSALLSRCWEQAVRFPWDMKISFQKISIEVINYWTFIAIGYHIGRFNMHFLFFLATERPSMVHNRNSSTASIMSHQFSHANRQFQSHQFRLFLRCSICQPLAVVFGLMAVFQVHRMRPGPCRRLLIWVARLGSKLGREGCGWVLLGRVWTW